MEACSPCSFLRSRGFRCECKEFVFNKSNVSKTKSEKLAHQSPIWLFTNPSLDLFPESILSDAGSPSSTGESITAAPNESDQSADPPHIQQDASVPNLSDSPSSPDLPQLRRSTRIRELSLHLRYFHCYSALATLYEPTTYREAPHWRKAMSEELQALEKKNTWDLVDLPSGKSAVGSKWGSLLGGRALSLRRLGLP